jgi:hypothetical protein
VTGLRVRATQRGYFGQERAVGDEFEIASKEQLGSWMEQISGKAVAEKSAPPADPFLARNADQIKADLAGLEVEQLAAYREQEAAAEKPRKGVIEAIDAAVAEKSANA